MVNAFLKLLTPVSASSVRIEETALEELTIQAPKGRYAYLPVQTNDLLWLKSARVYLCSFRTSSAPMLPWWRYPQARWGALSSDLRAWARLQQKNEEHFHFLSNEDRLFYSCLIHKRRRLIAEIELRVSVDEVLPKSDIRSLVSQVMTRVPFIPPLDIEDKRLARLLLLGKRGDDLALALGWTTNKLRSRRARLGRLFDADGHAELMDCLWLAHQRRSFNKNME